MTHPVSENTIPHTDYLEAFDSDKAGVEVLTTKYYTPGDVNNRMDYLEDIDISAESVLYSNTSGGGQRFFRLYIKNKKIILEYKLARGLAIDSGINETDMKGLVDPTEKLSDRDKIIYLYKNDKSVGKNVNESLYIDSAGVSHNIDSSKLDTEITTTIDGDTSLYADYKKYCYSGEALTSNELSKESVAKFNNYYLTKDELKNAYPSSNGTSCVGGSGVNILQLKKNAFNSNYGACMTNPQDVSMTNIGYYDTKLTQNPSNDFSDAKCDKKHVFSGAVEQFKSDRNTFRDIFADMIEKFNELNENELEMLNGTQESIENLKETISEYNELYDKATENEGKKTIIDAQTDDAKIVLKQSQHSMALMGIGAIGATMLMFNYMKK